MLTKPNNVAVVPPVLASPPVTASTVCPPATPSIPTPPTKTVNANQNVYLLLLGGVTYTVVEIIMPSGTMTSTFTPPLPAGIPYSLSAAVLVSSTTIQVSVPTT